MGIPLCLLGKKFGKLTVVEESPRKGPGNRTWWVCNCECGESTTTRGDRLRTGQTTSCGCNRLEWGRRNFETRRTHGMSEHPAYKAWQRMKSRCQNPKEPVYPYYGGRGISVCGAWVESFAAFWADMGATWAPGLSLDRIDNDGHYSPGNCRWTTPTEQNRNRRNVKLSVEAAEAIRRAYADGDSLQCISRQHAVSRPHALQVVDGRIWKPTA